MKSSLRCLNLMLQTMDHVVCLDAGAKELENLINGKKSMIIRGSDERDLPYRSVREGDILYFMSCIGDGEVKARGIVSYVYNSERLSMEASFETIIRNQDKLQLPDAQFYRMAGKKYLVLIGMEEIEVIEPIRIDRARFTSQDDWLQVGNINTLHPSP
jgi:hypothetical protein